MEVIKSETARLDALTGVRFIAVMLVFLHHNPPPMAVPAFVLTFFLSGYNGVTIFFVLSGFVLGLNYVDKLAKPDLKNLFTYGVARWARVYPLYFLVLIFDWLWKGAPASPSVTPYLLAIQPWFKDFLVMYNGPGWSIGVEFFLYASFPILIIFLARIKGKSSLWAMAGLIVAAMLALALFFHFNGLDNYDVLRPGEAHRWLYRFPVSRLGDFSLGVIASLLFKRISFTGKTISRWFGVITKVSLLTMVLLMTSKTLLYSVYSWDVLYAALAFVFILGLSLSKGDLVSNVLSSKFMVKLGEASFALYLIHVPLIEVFKVSEFWDYRFSVAMSLWILFFGVCLLLAIALNEYVERPIRNAINRGARKITTFF